MTKGLSFLITAAFGLFISSAAEATTLTFGSYDDFTVFGATYDEFGYRFTNSAASLSTWGNLSGQESDASNSSTVFTDLPSTTTLTRIDSNAFHLTSIDFDDVYNQGSPSGFLDYTYAFLGGGGGSGSFLVDTVPGLSTLFLDLDNLASFTFTPDNNLTWVQFDNAQVSAVPLPAALPFFGTALAGLGFLASRRRR